MPKTRLIVLTLFVCACGVWAQTPDPAADSIAELQRMMDVQVQSAALRKQSLQDAPASVTVITAEDIQRYGYRTLAEALSNTRSFYTISDGGFRYAGVRGFSLLGDYNMRFLVLLNGHQLTDNVYSAMYYFGYDFPVDMDIVDQIEIVRGPSSALYGSNGLFATVNIITRTANNAPRARVAAGVGSFGTTRLAASSAFSLGKGAKGMVSISAVHASGRNVTFPELAAQGLPFSTGHAEAEIGFHSFANVVWKNWSFTAAFGQHKAIAPSSWYGSDLGDTATTDLESRDFVEAAWSRPVGQNAEIRWRAYYDRFRYDGVFNYRKKSGYVNYDGALGDWVGSQFVYQRHTSRLGVLTAGVEGNVDIRNLQYDFNTAGGEAYGGFRINKRRASMGVFLQDEVTLAPAWTLYLAGRIDSDNHNPAFFSPRVALVYSRGSSAYKLMYGRAFRNPSTYEKYWQPSPDLEPERITTLEFAREQRIRKRLNLITSVFRYRLTNLIAGEYAGDNTLRYRNTWKASADGVEAELNGRPWDGAEMAGSFSIQRTRGVNSNTRMENSPARLAQFRASHELLKQHLTLAAAAHYVSGRINGYGERTPAVVLTDATVTVRRILPRLDLQFGVRNLLNRGYSDPLSTEHTVHGLPGAGRNGFIRLIWQNE